MSKSKPTKPARQQAGAGNPNAPRCGLCGKRSKLTRTECCGQWICDDEHKYVLFSYGRNSCYRNHRNHTLCAHHHAEGHAGKWQDCPKCREDFETEMYVWYGTNEYNFTKLKNPPAFSPTYCGKCGVRIILPDGGFSVLCGEYRCEKCPISDKEREGIISSYQDNCKGSRK